MGCFSVFSRSKSSKNQVINFDDISAPTSFFKVPQAALPPEFGALLSPKAAQPKEPDAQSEVSHPSVSNINTEIIDDIEREAFASVYPSDTLRTVDLLPTVNAKRGRDPIPSVLVSKKELTPSVLGDVASVASTKPEEASQWKRPSFLELDLDTLMEPTVLSEEADQNIQDDAENSQRKSKGKFSFLEVDEGPDWEVVESNMDFKSITQSTQAESEYTPPPPPPPPEVEVTEPIRETILSTENQQEAEQEIVVLQNSMKSRKPKSSSTKGKKRRSLKSSLNNKSTGNIPSKELTEISLTRQEKANTRSLSARIVSAGSVTSRGLPELDEIMVQQTPSIASHPRSGNSITRTLGKFRNSMRKSKRESLEQSSSPKTDTLMPIPTKAPPKKRFGFSLKKKKNTGESMILEARAQPLGMSTGFRSDFERRQKNNRRVKSFKPKAGFLKARLQAYINEASRGKPGDLMVSGRFEEVEELMN